MKLFLTLFFIISFYLIKAQSFSPPKAKRIKDITFLHGDTLVDNYNWMKNKNDINLINYLYAENAYTDNVMQSTNLLQKELYGELLSKMREDDVSIPIKREDYYYYSKSKKGKNYGILCRKYKSLNATEEIYLDINKLAENFQFFNLTGTSISPNHNMVAYSIDSKGDESATLYIKDIKGDTLLQDKIENVSQFIWAEDNKTILYVLHDTKTKKNNKIYKHILNSNIDDELIFEEKRPKFSPGLGKSSSKEYIFISTGSFLESEMLYTSAKNPNSFKLIIPAESKVYYGGDHFGGDEFIMLTNKNAPNNKIISIGINNNELKTIIEASDSITINNYHLFKDYAIIEKIENGLNRIEIKNLKTNSSYYLGDVNKLQDIGISHYFKFNEQKLWYYTNSYIEPPVLYEYNLVTKKDSLLRDYSFKNYDKTKYESKRIWSTSMDGTKVPIDIAYKKSTKINENTPLYMTAYASYGSNSFPSFSSTTVMLMDRGFIFAEAHPRGESIFGKKWHDEGKMLNKINTVTDFISCTEYLHKNGYSSPQKTAITGRSAGGMLMGAIVTMRPDLYQAVVPGVPYIDVINGQLDTTMPGTIAHFDEVGNPRIKKQYEAFLKWDPYQNIKKVDYPNILVLSGYNDPRVYYWLPTKWTAKMREYKTDSNMFLLKTDMESGHFGTSGRYKALKETAFEFAFIFKALDIKESYKNITGTIYDKNGETVPFANVLIKGTQKGTASNFNGVFSITVREDEPQKIIVSSVGFKDYILDLKNYYKDTITITLQSEDILLRNVEVNANAKDPAYGIIKNTIEKRKFHLKQIKSYEANIYLKSTVRFDKLPEKLPFFIPKDEMPDSSDLGLIYLSESSSKVYYNAPNKMKEEMYASVVAGEKQGFSFNRTSDVLFNFYENNIELPNISDKLFQSPISSTALISYRYRYDGTIFENGKQIHKIYVYPRIKGDALFYGHIYINDSTWSIHSLNLMLTKDANLKFYDTLNFKQSSINIDNIWIPRSVNLSSKISIFGLGATFSSNGIFSNYNLNKDFPRNFFSNEIFKIDENANKKDSIYWEDNRPISLTEEERQNYYEADSIEKVENSPEYKDSIRKLYNKNSIGDMISDGYYYSFKSDSSWIYTNSLLNAIGFNTVEGWSGKLTTSYTKILPKDKRYNLDLSTRYGFEIKDWGAKIDAFLILDNKKFESISFSGGKYIDKLNQSNFNMWYSLLDKRNYTKINQKTYAKITYRRELINGLYVKPSFEIASRKYLSNHSSISWIKTNRDYTPNFPWINNSINPYNHDQITAEISARYVINQKYSLYPHSKWTEPSKLPVLSGKFKMGIGLSDKETSYQFASASIQQKLKLGRIGNLTYNATLGKFFNGDKIQFWDYKHFVGNQTLFVTPQSDAFETLPYFSHSTNKEYAEVHVIHQFNGFIMNKLPLIRKLRWESFAGINSVMIPSKNYHELYFGIENIFKVLRVDFAGALGNGKFTPAVRIGLEFGL